MQRAPTNTKCVKLGRDLEVAEFGRPSKRQKSCNGPKSHLRGKKKKQTTTNKCLKTSTSCWANPHKFPYYYEGKTALLKLQYKKKKNAEKVKLEFPQSDTR